MTEPDEPGKSESAGTAGSDLPPSMLMHPATFDFEDDAEVEHVRLVDVDALLAERDRLAAQLAAVRVIIQSALVEHEPAETVTGVPPTCPTCHDPAPCGTYAFLSAALDAAGRDDGGWARPPSTPEETARLCQTAGHEEIPAAMVGTLFMDDEATPDVAYCAECAMAMVADGCYVSGTESPSQRSPDPLHIVRLSRDDIDGGWIAECVDLPGCMTDGDTREDAWRNLLYAIECVAAASPSTPEAGHG